MKNKVFKEEHSKRVKRLTTIAKMPTAEFDNYLELSGKIRKIVSNKELTKDQQFEKIEELEDHYESFIKHLRIMAGQI